MKNLFSRTIIIGLFAVLVSSLPLSAFAHHGWAWSTGGNYELTGTITESKLGNPHGILKVEVNGEIWTVEVGQPWRNERAGLTDEDYAPGKEIRFIGEPSSDESERLLKAERVYINDREYELYPDRD
jgi:hypothetical protein